MGYNNLNKIFRTFILAITFSSFILVGSSSIAAEDSQEMSNAERYRELAKSYEAKGDYKSAEKFKKLADDLDKVDEFFEADRNIVKK